MHREEHLKHPALEPLWRSLERDWRQQLIAILLLLTVGVATLAIGMRGVLLVLMIGVVFMVIAARLLYRHFYQPSTLQRLLTLLHDQPQEVVWVYSIVLDHHPFGLQMQQRGILYFKLADGDEISASLPPKRLKLISRVLSRALPGVVFGYSKERDRQFRRDPRGLR